MLGQPTAARRQKTDPAELDGKMVTSKLRGAVLGATGKLSIVASPAQLTEP